MNQAEKFFLNLRKEINSIYEDLDLLKENLSKNNEIMKEFTRILEKFIIKKEDSIYEKKENDMTIKQKNSTSTTINSTHNLSLEGLKHINLPISIRNDGVSTDRQTDQQTDRHTEKERDSFDNALEVLNSLDNIKKDIRLKFKKLTEQELLVFSTIYQLDEEIGYSDYKSLSERLNLTESSIRDYIGRLIKKGIPVEKTKINNKNIKLSISNNLKKIASLSTILQLKDL